MASLPTPIRAYIGLLASAAEQAQHLVARAPELPVEAVGNAMQLSMRAQQRYTELVARGDALLGHLKPTPAQPPSWATFDEDEPAPTPTFGDVLDADVVIGDVPEIDEIVATFEPAIDLPDGAGARFEEDDHPVVATASGTPLAPHGDPLVAGSDGVIALPAKTRAARTAPARKRAPRPVKAAAAEAVPDAATPDLPAIPESLLGGTTAKRAAARARKATPAAIAADEPPTEHVTLATFEPPVETE